MKRKEKKERKEERKKERGKKERFHGLIKADLYESH